MTIAFVDLDNTLIYSARAIRSTGVEPLDNPELVAVERINGEPSAFTTLAALTGLNALASSVTVVPTTTRTREQYHRLDLFASTPEFAIIGNGAIIEIDGCEDESWDLGMRVAAEQGSIHLAEALQLVVAIADARPGSRVSVRDDRFLRIACAVPAPLSPVERDLLREGGWEGFRDGRHLYIVPRSLGKLPATQHVQRLASASFSIAAGDSELDQDYVAAADAAFVPAHAFLAPTSPPPIVVGAVSGVGASAELIEWMWDVAIDSVTPTTSLVKGD